MKAKMMITGDTTNPDFMSLQSLCIEHGFTVTMALCKEEVAKPVVALASGKRGPRPNGRHCLIGSTLDKEIVKWLMTMNNRRASRKAYDAKVVALGFASRTSSANLHRMVKAKQVTVENDVIQLI